jgi:flagellin-specific chaperone FliS
MNYLENEVHSATPQKLRLMLIDGALRFARKTLEHWQQHDADAASEALARARAIVIELISSVRMERKDCEFIIDHAAGRPRPSQEHRQREIESLHQVACNTAAVYLVVMRELNEAQLHDAPAKIEAAIRILQVERETLRLVCEQHPHAPQLATPKAAAEITSTHAAALLAGPMAASFGGPVVYGDAHRAVGSLSFDA